MNSQDQRSTSIKKCSILFGELLVNRLVEKLRVMRTTLCGAEDGKIANSLRGYRVKALYCTNDPIKIKISEVDKD